MPEELPAWLITAREKYPPPLPVEQGPVAAGDVRLVAFHSEHGSRNAHVVVMAIDEPTPWAEHRGGTATVCICTSSVEMATHQDVRIAGAPYPLLASPMHVTTVFMDHLGEVVHRVPEMADALMMTSYTGRPEEAGLEPAGLPIRAPQDPRLKERRRHMFEPIQAITDVWEIDRLSDQYLEQHPDYDGPGVIGH